MVKSQDRIAIYNGKNHRWPGGTVLFVHVDICGHGTVAFENKGLSGGDLSCTDFKYIMKITYTTSSRWYSLPAETDWLQQSLFYSHWETEESEDRPCLRSGEFRPQQPYKAGLALAFSHLGRETIAECILSNMYKLSIIDHWLGYTISTRYI